MCGARSEIISIAVETSGRTGSVALARGDRLVGETSFRVEHQHGVELLPTVERLCAEQGVAAEEIRHVYVSGGPGSFTGLRIGITFAKVLALATEARVVRVPSLEVIAQNALHLQPRPERVVVLLDAKRARVYCGAFRLERDRYRPFDAADERDPLDYLATLGTVTAIGDGTRRHAEAIAASPHVTLGGDDLNRARASRVFELGRRMADAGDFARADLVTPIYVRRPDAEEKWERRRAERNK